MILKINHTTPENPVVGIRREWIYEISLNYETLMDERMTMSKTDMFDRDFEGDSIDSFEYTFMNKAKIISEGIIKTKKNQSIKQIYPQFEKEIMEAPDSFFKLYTLEYNYGDMALERPDGIKQLVDSAYLTLCDYNLKFITYPDFKDLSTLICKNVTGSLEILDKNKTYHRIGDVSWMELSIINNNMSFNNSPRTIVGHVDIQIKCELMDLNDKAYHEHLYCSENGVIDMSKSFSTAKTFKIKFEQSTLGKNLYTSFEGVVDISNISHGHLEMTCMNVGVMIEFNRCRYSP